MPIFLLYESNFED